MKKIVTYICVFMMTLLIAGGVIEKTDVYASESQESYYLQDNAECLTSEEYRHIEKRLESLSDRYQMDLVIYIESVNITESSQDIADNLFDYNGYGVGDKRSGNLLYINLLTRDWAISARGDAEKPFPDSNCEKIGSKISSELGNDQYYDALVKYLDLCEQELNIYENGQPYPALRYIIIALVAGLIAAVLCVLVLKGQLKSVHPQDSAAEYIVKDSLHVKDAGNFYLYSTVSRMKKAKEESSGHTSSSGAHHTGASGKF